MKLVELTESDKHSFNEFVAAQESGSFLQSWEWGEWQEKLGKAARRFFLLDDTDQIIAALQVIHQPLPFGQYYVYLPYGPIVSTGFKMEDLKFLIQELREHYDGITFIRVEPKSHIE